MLFSSPIFLFAFLPLLLALHALRKMTLFERKSLVDYALGYSAVDFCHGAVCLMTAM